MSPFSPRRTRLAGIALLAATFAAGMLAGAASDRVLDARESGPADERASRGHSGRMILDRLDLTPVQRVRVDSIMARGRDLTDSLWRHDGERIRAAVASTRAEIREVLTPEQAAEYDRLREAQDQRHREKGERDKRAP